MAPVLAEIDWTADCDLWERVWRTWDGGEEMGEVRWERWDGIEVVSLVLSGANGGQLISYQAYTTPIAQHTGLGIVLVLDQVPPSGTRPFPLAVDRR